MAPAQACSPTSCFRLLDTALVTPSGPPLPSCSLPLTFLDLQWLHAPPVERLFHYRRHNHDTTADQLVSRLKASLSAALRLYFPLAGHLRTKPGTAARHEIFYQPGDGVAFTLAECDNGADLASDQRPRRVIDLARFVPLLRNADAGAAVLAVQATVLLPRGDVALGVTVHHAACDGSGSTAFLRTWAAACAGDNALSFAPPPPVIDRTLVVDGGLYNQYARKLPSTDEWEFVKTSPDQLLATFTLTSEQLKGVKDAVAGEAARRGLTPPRCSTLVAALGVVWSCYRRAKPEEKGTAYFILPVDHRQGMKVPAAYLGNCLGTAIAAAPCQDLASPGACGVFAACAAISAAIGKAVALPEWETLLERVKEAGAGGALSVAGSPRFRVYDVDFGCGPPAKVDMVSVARTAAVALAESGRGGGIEVGMSFSAAGMEAFQRCFAEAVAWVSPSSSCGAAHTATASLPSSIIAS